MKPSELVVLGGPDSGKTHYAGQLYGRLQRCPGALRLRREAGTPPDLSPLNEVLGCLENGRSAGHTPTGTWAEVHLPLVDGAGRATDLRWPDYGGEQVKAVAESRAVTSSWRDRLVAARGWLLFIRASAETTYPDALERLAQRPSAAAAPGARAVGWDASARLTELLQILLHVAGVGTAYRVSSPRLAVLLSCYDELPCDAKPPQGYLDERFPLLSSFIESTWQPGSSSIWGLSSLGKALADDGSDHDFIDEGPEQQGWVIPPEGARRDADLSLPLAWLLE
jgi:hypothetical protein